MNKNTIDAETAKWAGLQIDMLHKIRKGNINLEEVKNFLGYTGIVNLLNLQIDMLQKVNSDDLNFDKLEHFLTLKKRKMVQNLLFGSPLLEKQVTISEKFSLDKNIVPKKEFKYGYVSDCIRDNYFGDQTIIGKATLKIVPTTRRVTNRELDKAANQKDAKAIVAALHNMLVANPNSLDEFKDRVIVIPVLSKVPPAYDYLFCLRLYWDGDAWSWDYYWLGYEWNAGVHVASLS